MTPAALPAVWLASSSAISAPQTPSAPSSYTAGVEARHKGRTAEAVVLLRAAVRERPEDADAWLQLGLALAAVGEHDEAEKALRHAQAIAPDYVEVQVSLARLSYFRGDLAEAERRLNPVLNMRARNAEALELRAALERARRSPDASAPEWRLDVGGSYSGLSSGLQPWRETSGFLTRRAGDTSLTAGVRSTRRFGRQDVFGEVRADRRVSEGLGGYAALGGAPGADHQPEWSLKAGLGSIAVRGDRGFAWNLDAGWARYGSGNVRSLSPGAAFALSDQAELRAQWINTIDERDDHRAGYAVRGTWAAADRLRFTFGWADAPESSEGRTVDVEALSAGVAFDLGQRATVRLDLVAEDRGAYDRDELALGFARRF